MSPERDNYIYNWRPQPIQISESFGLVKATIVITSYIVIALSAICVFDTFKD